VFLVALACLTPGGTAGAALYVAGHAGAKAALFLVGGVMLARYGSVDEVDLHGRGVDTRVMKWLIVVGGLALSCLPPFGTALGKSVAEDAAVSSGYIWVPALFVAVSALTGGAVLRVAGRVYFGLGPRPRESREETSGSHEERESPPLQQVPITMLLPIVVLLGAALALGVLPGAHRAAERAADYFVNGPAYQAQALAAAPDRVVAAATGNWTAEGVGLGLASSALALAVAGAGIWSRPIRDRFPRIAIGSRPLAALRRLHSGHIGDYVAWLMLGLAAIGGFVGLPLR
jgi:multicomponent Na+:H+ antiporter subunit D